MVIQPFPRGPLVNAQVSREHSVASLRQLSLVHQWTKLVFQGRLLPCFRMPATGRAGGAFR
eukprot:9278492-Karenia_brevis.AAC.1